MARLRKERKVKKLIMGIALGTVLILAVACTGNSGVAPVHEAAFQACIEARIEEDGYTKSYASRLCACAIDSLPEFFSVEKINAVFLDEDYEADLADISVMVDVSMECLSKE